MPLKHQGDLGLTWSLVSRLQMVQNTAVRLLTGTKQQAYNPRPGLSPLAVSASQDPLPQILSMFFLPAPLDLVVRVFFTSPAADPAGLWSHLTYYHL